MSTAPWSTAWTIARRDLHRRFRGLRLLVVCMFLGVGALAAIGTLTGAIRDELATQGRAILGGDLEVQVWQRLLTAEERDFLAHYGALSEGVRMEALARTSDAAAPVELKAVDERWPLYGRFTLADGRVTGAPLPGQAWLADGAAARLGVKPGDSIKLGTANLVVGGIIGDEPDKLGEGFQLGPTVIVRGDVPARAGLTAPGALYQTKVRIRFAGETDPAKLEDVIKQRFPDSGFQVRTRDTASPGAERFVSRMGQFLTLVGLAALAIAGIGIGGGVASYLDSRRTGIATLKILGATSGDIARIYALEIGAAALAGAIAGLAGGFLVTPLLSDLLGSLLPVRSGFVVAPWALARAALFGLLVALVSAASPLAAARLFPAMALMRARVTPLGHAGRVAALPIALGLTGIVLLALIGAPDPLLTATFLGGAVALFALLALLGLAIRRVAARLPRPNDPLLRAGLANLHRPGAATTALVTALGFGLSAFVLLAAVETSLDANIARTVPARAPDYFVLDIPQDGVAPFLGLVGRDAPGSVVRTVPTLRGAILAYGPREHMTRVSDLKDLPRGAWALRGERGLTYADRVPEGNTLTAGAWWPAHYAGEPLVSVDEDFANSTGLKVGDYLTIGVLGAERTARIANLRRIDWDSLGFNYVLVFSPSALEDVPHSFAATINLPSGASAHTLLRDLANRLPASSAIEVGPLLTQARDLLNKVALAILAAASVAVLAGIAVLLGAIAAARAARTYDSVILRVLGASRRQLLVSQLAEFGALSLILALVSLALGTGLAWLVVVKLFKFAWLPDWPRILGVLAAGTALVLAFAMSASLPLLRARPAQALRTL